MAAGLAVISGVLAVYGPTAGLCVAALLVFVGATNARFSAWAAVAIVVVVGVPILYLGNSVQPSVALAGHAVSVQLVIIYFTAFCAAAVLLGTRSNSRIDLMAHGLSTAFIVWILAVLLVAAVNQGATVGRLTVVTGLAYHMVPVFIVVPFGLVRLTPQAAAHRVLACLMGAAALAAAIVLVVYSVPGLRMAVFGATSYGVVMRVGFGNGSLFALSLPVAMVLLRLPGMGRWTRWGLDLLVLETIGAVLVSQSRSLMVATAVNVLLVLLATDRRRRAAWRRLVRVFAVIIVVLGIAFALASATGIGGVNTLPHALGERLGELKNPMQVATLQTRLITNEMAMRQWVATPKSFIVGHGFGVKMGAYSGLSPQMAHRVVGRIDNAWLTVANTGGIVLLAAFGLTLFAAFGSFVRAARRDRDAVTRVAWLALAVSFPMFVVESTLVTSHYPAVPAVLVTLACLTAASDLACAGTRVRSSCPKSQPTDRSW